jgi:acyl carrier protein
MNRARVEATVREVMQVVLGHSLAPGADVRRADEPAWDSLAHVNLIFSVESELGIQFGPEELDALDSLERLVAAADAHLRATA